MTFVAVMFPGGYYYMLDLSHPSVYPSFSFKEHLPKQRKTASQSEKNIKITLVAGAASKKKTNFDTTGV